MICATPRQRGLRQAQQSQLSTRASSSSPTPSSSLWCSLRIICFSVVTSSSSMPNCGQQSSAGCNSETWATVRGLTRLETKLVELLVSVSFAQRLKKTIARHVHGRHGSSQPPWCGDPGGARPGSEPPQAPAAPGGRRVAVSLLPCGNPAIARTRRPPTTRRRDRALTSATNSSPPASVTSGEATGRAGQGLEAAAGCASMKPARPDARRAP